MALTSEQSGHESAMYSNAEVYDRINGGRREDIAYYIRQAKEFGGPVLELACGTGRITSAIANEGIPICGIDLSEPMLQAAWAKTQPGMDVEYIRTDIAQFSLKRKFKLIFLPFNSICHLSSYDQIMSMFESVKKHLLPGGRLIIDVFVPDPSFLARKTDDWSLVVDEADLKVRESSDYDHAAQVNNFIWEYSYKAEHWVERWSMRMFFPQELQAYIRWAGFEIKSAASDYQGSPLGKTCTSQIYICSPLFS